MNNTRIYYKITIERNKYAHEWTKRVKKINEKIGYSSEKLLHTHKKKYII